MKHQIVLTVQSPDEIDGAIEAIKDFISLGRSKCEGATKDPLAIKYLETELLDVKKHLASEHIVVDPNIMSGKPVLKGTRIPISQLLANLLDVTKIEVDEIADDFDIDRNDLYRAFQEIAVHYENR